MAVSHAIWTHPQPSTQVLSGGRSAPLAGPANPGDPGNNDPSDPSTSSATISANDFLTLLVTEMQNQDPTDQTDPNEYINQLVQVNSLEQLIDINQNLTTALGGSASTSGQAAAGQDVSQAAASGPSRIDAASAGLAPTTQSGAPDVVHTVAHKSSALGQVQAAAAAGSAETHAASHTRAVSHAKPGQQTAPGNLSMPGASAAAGRVAHALSGQLHAR